MLTGRGAARIRRVARTIADLEDRPEIAERHIERACLIREDLW
jgi:predicted ATPase with chaperone activity